MDDHKLTFKEFLIVCGITLLLSPIGYFIVFAPMGWWIK